MKNNKMMYLPTCDRLVRSDSEIEKNKMREKNVK